MAALAEAEFMWVPSWQSNLASLFAFLMSISVAFVKPLAAFFTLASWSGLRKV
jgi:hypothetical protein